MIESNLPEKTISNTQLDYPALVCDERGLNIKVDRDTIINVKDNKGNITADRFPWIRQFLCVRRLSLGYEVLYHLNNGSFAKWSIDPEGCKTAFCNLDDKSIAEIESEFNIDIKILYPQYRESLEQQEKAEKFYKKAKKYQSLGQHARAEICYSRAIATAPEKSRYLQGLATCLSIKKKFGQALDVYLFLAAKQPDRELDVWHFKHKLLTYLKQYKDEFVLNNAIFVFERIVAISKARSSALDLLGDLYWYKQNQRKAVRLKALAATENVLPLDQIKIYNPEEISINTADLRLPDFLVVGPQKSGTTALYQYISDHPQVYPASLKEIFFFDLKYKFGIDWYKSHFPVLPEKRFLTGEGSATYFNSKIAADRIAEVIPNVKLIFILRDPVDRAISDYHMKVRDGLETRDIETALISEIEYLSQEWIDILEPGQEFFKTHKGYIRNGLYYCFLKNYLNIFPATSIIIINAKELLEFPKITMKSVFDFLELEAHEGSYPVVNRGNYPKDLSEQFIKNLSLFFDPHNKKLKSEFQLNWD